MTDAPDGPTAVYLYTPPQWRFVHKHAGWSLLFGIMTNTTVYRLGGVWHNIQDPGQDQPHVADCDTDAVTGLHLYFNKPMVIPGSLYVELAALTPADSGWTPAMLTLL